MSTKKQRATSKRNWGVLQMKGALAFLKQMGVSEETLAELNITCRKALWARYERDLK